jgi:hypothetical protein
MIEILKGFPDNVAAFACHGQVTQRDYTTALLPAVEKALKEHDKVRIYYETADDFEEIEPSAVWEDTKVGLKNWRRWEKMAVVTDMEWIKLVMKAFAFLMPGEIRTFSLSEAGRAREWIVAA